MKTQDLIKQLVQDSKPVKRIAPYKIRLLLWFLISLGITLAAIFIWGLRSDLSIRLYEWSFILEMLILFLMMLSASFSAFSLSVPGESSPRGLRLLACLSLFLWLGLIFLSTFLRQGHLGWSAKAWLPGWGCMNHTLLLVILPTFLIFILLKRAAVLRPILVGALAGLSAVSFAAVAMRLTCHSDALWHLLFWHIGPIVLVTAIAILLGAWLFNWIAKEKLSKK